MILDTVTYEDFNNPYDAIQAVDIAIALTLNFGHYYKEVVNDRSLYVDGMGYIFSMA